MAAVVNKVLLAFVCHIMNPVTLNSGPYGKWRFHKILSPSDIVTALACVSVCCDGHSVMKLPNNIFLGLYSLH